MTCCYMAFTFYSWHFINDNKIEYNSLTTHYLMITLLKYLCKFVWWGELNFTYVNLIDQNGWNKNIYCM